MGFGGLYRWWGRESETDATDGGRDRERDARRIDRRAPDSLRHSHDHKTSASSANDDDAEQTAMDQ